MSSSDTEEVKEKLADTEGRSITLPGSVVEHGFLLFGTKNIAMVNERKLKILEHIYKDRLFWNSTTGLFTITRLQRNDSGIYHIDSKTGSFFSASYKLTVYGKIYIFMASILTSVLFIT